MDETLQVSPLTFTDFLEKMKDPKAADLVRAIKTFIASFRNIEMDGEVCSQRVQQFLSMCESTFRSHPLWAGSNETGLEAAMEGLEKYIMTKLYDRCFRISASDREGDELLAVHLHALEFVKPEHLDIPDYFRNEAQWVLAQKELQKINSYKAPRDKLVCILNCCRVITNLLNVHSNGPAGADDFFPVLVYVVIRTNPPNLKSNLEYIRRFRSQSRLVSEAAYYYTNTESAAQFVQHINSSSLTIDSDLFIARMTAAGVPLERIQPPVAAAALLPVSTQQTTSEPGAPSAYASLALSPDLPAMVVKRSVAELEAEGVGHMLEAEAMGQLRDGYRWLYSTAAELTVRDVESLLASYKEVALRYEAITRAILAQSAVDLGHLAVPAPPPAPAPKARLPASPVRAAAPLVSLEPAEAATHTESAAGVLQPEVVEDVPEGLLEEVSEPPQISVTAGLDPVANAGSNANGTAVATHDQLDLLASPSPAEAPPAEVQPVAADSDELQTTPAEKGVAAEATGETQGSGGEDSVTAEAQGVNLLDGVPTAAEPVLASGPDLLSDGALQHKASQEPGTNDSSHDARQSEPQLEGCDDAVADIIPEGGPVDRDGNVGVADLAMPSTDGEVQEGGESKAEVPCADPSPLLASDTSEVLTQLEESRGADPVTTGSLGTAESLI